MSNQGLFSKRNNYVPDKFLQIDNIDIDLRNRLWNIIGSKICYQAMIGYTSTGMGSEPRAFYREFWRDYLKIPIDECPNSQTAVLMHLKNYCLTCIWYQLYDLLELFLKKYPAFSNEVNLILESENSAYRVDVNANIVKITNENELDTINAALSSPLMGVNIHLQNSIRFFSDRINPDYHKSVQESINAVESICCHITQEESSSLGKTLIKLENIYGLHPALKLAFSKLYGYTSDEEGIRHAILEDPNKVGFSEAYFMLVTCSAFINYLQQKFEINN